MAKKSTGDGAKGSSNRDGSGGDRYPKYKDSGTEWIGEVPEHWKIAPLGYASEILVSNIDKKSVSGEEEVLLCNYVDVYKNEIVTPDIDFMKATAKEDSINKLRLLDGDVVITKDSETADDIASPAYIQNPIYNLVCGYHLAIIRPNKSYSDGKFLLWAVMGNSSSVQFENQAKGVTRVGLSRLSIKNTKITLPPLIEQKAIAAYLDEKTAEIDELVAEQEQLIKLLKEKRSALISETVTRGLDPDVKMKDSGIEWIGEVPEHWNIGKIKHVLTIKNGQDHKAVENPDGDFLVYGSGGAFAQSDSALYSGESILFGRKGTIDKPIYVNESFWTVDTMFYSIPLGTSVPKFSYYLALCILFDKIQTKTALPSITQFSLGNYPIPAPSPPEQKAIAAYLDEKTAEIDELVAKSEEMIALLKERRSALISEVVTGKRRVSV